MKKQSNLETIQTKAAQGVIGTLNVRTCDLKVIVVEGRNTRWLLDAATGVHLSTAVNDTPIQMLGTQLTCAQHQTFSAEIKAVNSISKWVEVLYQEWPLSTEGVEVYEGQFVAPRLDAVDVLHDTEKAAHELVGLEAGEVGTPIQGRIWNVTGSKAHKGGEFNRIVDAEHCTLEFSTTTGKYRLTKKPSCAAFYAPVSGLQWHDVAVADLLDGCSAAPQIEPVEVFEKQLMSARYKR